MRAREHQRALRLVARRVELIGAQVAQTPQSVRDGMAARVVEEARELPDRALAPEAAAHLRALKRIERRVQHLG